MTNTRFTPKNIANYILFLFVLAHSSGIYAQEDQEQKKGDKTEPKVEQLGRSIKLKDFTGAASVLSGKTIDKSAFNNTKNALAGYIPGLYVSQGGGEPGAEWSSMFIRGKRTTSNGSNAPYILVDGFERDMNYMDLNEIESITVLKDAAATAIYGLKGASGVIEVKTKRGHEGKTMVTFDSQATLKSALDIPASLGAADYMTYYNQARVNDGNPADFYSPVLIDAYKNNSNSYRYADVNWMNQFFNKTSYKQRYSITVEGGSKIAKYYLNFSYLGDKGNLVTEPAVNKYSTQNKWDKYAIRTNIDVQITPKLLFQVGLSSMFGFVTTPSNNSGTAIYRSLLNYIPNAHPILNEDGSIAGNQFYNNNPYKVINYGGYAETYTRYVTATTRLNYDLGDITKGLSAFGAFAFDNNYVYTSKRLKQKATYELIIDPVTNEPKLDLNGNKTYKEWGTNTPLALSGSSGSYYRMMNYEMGLNYKRTIGGFNFSARATGFNYDYQDDVKLAHAMAGVNAGINCNYDSKYFIDLNGSWSGTEQFPSENRMFLYPAIGLGWVPTNETFLKNNPIISYLKLRGSYGISGSDNMSNNGKNLYYNYIMSLSKGGTTFFGEGNPASITAGSFSTGYVEGAIANPTLRPESTEKFDIGMDASFLVNRLTVGFDYFNEYTSNILAYSKSMPGMMGVPSSNLMLGNIGKMSNKGFEIQIGWSENIGNVGYFMNATATYAQNRIEYLDEEPGLAEPQTGYPIDAYWGFKTSGFFQDDAEVASWADQSGVGRSTKGDLKFVNQNPTEDNKIDDYDRVYLGKVGMPDWFYGINLGASLKGFQLSCLFQGVEGLNKVFRDGINTPFSNLGNIYDFQKGNFWTEEHSLNPLYPRLTINGSSSTKAKADFWIKDASYLRLKNMELSYTFATKWVNENSNIKVYLSGTNLFSFDKLNGLVDPDISSDGLGYPVNRMLSLGIRMKL
ncbi:MAG: SusC/RagA family TonB-linked outer membrane protein [Bacteroidia bacterium]|nr:SusC/RagA family TonB-linked outer membrane protein [Bacteroidia bacterium]